MLHNDEFDGRLSDLDVLQVFNTLLPDLAAFAEAHNLFVRKYIHDCPMWGFYFRHPNDGRGSVILSIFRKEIEFGAGASGEWHVDNEETLERSTYEIPPRYISASSPDIVLSALEDVLSQLITAPVSRRSATSRIMERPKDKSGKAVYGLFERSLQVAK